MALMDAVPNQPRLHLISALRMVERQDQGDALGSPVYPEALGNTGTDVILLKGAAYVMAGLPATKWSALFRY